MSFLLDQLKLFRLPAEPAPLEHHIVLGARIVSYRLTRGKRRSIGMTIDQRGLRVGAPRSAPLDAIEWFIRHNTEWVLRKLDEWQHAQAGAFMAVDGAVVPLLGEPWTLRLARGNSRLQFIEPARELVLSVRENAAPRDTLRAKLREHALDVFLARAVRFGPQLNVELPPIALSNAQTRWGSCSNQSGVRLNWRLIHLPHAQIDYVIAHEFAHLSHMDHSPRFWAEVARLYPDFDTARGELKRMATSIPRI